MDEEKVEAKGMEAAEKIGNTASDLAATTRTNVQGLIDKGSSVAQDLSEAGTRAATQAGEVIRSVTRDAADQAGAAATTLYRRGANAGGYVSQYVAEQPLAALLMAGAVGYGLAYLIHRR